MSVHQSNKHDSAPLHVTGQAHYVDDIPTPEGTLHLAFGTSTCPHGHITQMDLDPVRAAPGVVAVLTDRDIPGRNDVSPSPTPEPLLTSDLVEYHGQPIFIVVATSHLAARRAARAARIEYAPLPAILSLDDAIANPTRFDAGGKERVYTKGKPEIAFDKARHVIKGSFDLGGQEHFYLEGQAALCIPGEGAEVTILSSTQHPTEIQHKVAEALDIPFHAVTTITRRMGGGFGGKESQGNHLAIACALASRVTGQACKMRYDRDDDMAITGKRHPFRLQYKAGFDEDGRLLALDMTHYVDCGWSQDLSLPVADRAMLHTDNAYHLSDVRITSHRLKTNTCSHTAFRGFGGPQGMVGIERVMEHIAQTLGRDPLEIRQVNYYKPGAGGQTTPYHQPVTDNIIHEITEALLASSDYAARRAEIEAWNRTSPVIKRGIGLTPVKFGISFTLTHLNQAGALVHIYTDGSIRLNHGGTEMGQGLFTKVAAVAASVFGQPIDAVRITATDTAKVPNTSATAASSGSDLNGMATYNACMTIRDRLVHFASDFFVCDPKEVVFRDGIVDIAGAEFPFADLVKEAYMARISLSATGFYATPEIAWNRDAGRGTPFYYFAYGAAVSEVALDTLTGENRILRADILHDVGNSLNPAIDIGQIEGGYVQGAGWLTTEELVWHPSGALWTHAPSTYKIPACSDRPKVFNVDLFDGENPAQTVYRSKAVGEPPLMLPISVVSALQHAVAQAGGDPLFDLPATPERLLNAVERGHGRGW
ncbi:xanthine dehydrogenase large subunit [Rubricella aquisinus]|uniref:Xanthine dehydrogenase large subunit n=1 Tax=Rubricella aquisinus TaxID=2028108 RepID=A0A840WJ06_9RHOB|nr:xanthine dehydrogenase molybdopterin binding subunit [Rubricella aquisinus]MBB5515079.1 xanthine dehydrogenase large subunit [Rubricella aquisinus]